MRKLIVCGVGLVAVLALTVPGAFGGAAQTPGVTAKSITIGGTFPLTGPAATYAPIPVGMKAYFAYINARKGPDGKRGVMGRQIVWKYYDDGYNTAQTAQLTRRLVEQDKVFATVGQLGTEPVLASRAYMNQQKVPQALVFTGASYWGLQYKEYPWTTGWQPDYIAEGRLYGLHAKANHRGKKIAIVYQNDDYGKDYLYGFLAALGKQYADANVVAREPVETTATSVAAQMIRIRASGAQVLTVFQLPRPSATTIGTAKALGVNPDQIYLNSVAAIKPIMDGLVASLGAPYVQRHHHRPLHQGSGRSAVGQRRRDEAVQDDHREVRRWPESGRRSGLHRSRQGRGVRAGALPGRQEPDAREPHERPYEHELPEQVPAPRGRPEVVEDGSLHREPDAAPSVQLDDEALGAQWQADRGSPTLEVSLYV